MNEIVFKIVYKVAILFIMMVPGIILKKTNMISDGLWTDMIIIST